VFGTFGWINEAAHCAALCASGSGSGAVMDTDLDHHGVKFTGGCNIHRTNVGFDNLLELIVRCVEDVDYVGVDACACQEAPGIGVDDEQWVVTTVQHDGISAFAADLGKC
jgi:hypothetical protein